MANQKISAERLRELLHYDPLAGVFTWRVKRNSRAGLVRPGAVAGCRTNRAYRVIRLDGILYYEQVLAWFYVTRTWPTREIDHKDTIRDHNWFSNLRDVTKSVNQQNQIKANRANKSSGLLGVAKSRNRWVAKICLNRKQRYIGTFDTPELAYAAYVEVKRKIHEGCTI